MNFGEKVEKVWRAIERIVMKSLLDLKSELWLCFSVMIIILYQLLIQELITISKLEWN
jgi:hypothetical protein